MYTEIVQQIHNEFDISVDVLLDFADLNQKQSDNIRIEKQELGNITVLTQFGFNNKDVREYLEKMRLKKEFQKNTAIKSEIIKFQNMLPGYKFITLSQVYEICEKYDLYIGASSLFEGDIPQKNIDDMSKFPYNKLQNHSYGLCLSYNGYLSADKNNPMFNIGVKSTLTFAICAPKSDFNEENQVIIGRELFQDSSLYKNEFKIEKNDRVIPDPIVLCPLSRIGKDILFAIVTAWGPEAQDPSVFNEINN